MITKPLNHIQRRRSEAIIGSWKEKMSNDAKRDLELENAQLMIKQALNNKIQSVLEKQSIRRTKKELENLAEIFS